MSDPANRLSMKDTVKKRREYLWIRCASRAAFVAGGTTSLFCACLLFLWLDRTGLFPRVIASMPQWLYWPVRHTWSAFLRLVPGPMGVVWSLCLAGLGGILLSYRSAKTLKALPYLAQVVQPVGTLSADDEVLLRGSDQPTAAPEELLRAAQAGTETDAQELLRAERAHSYEQQTDAVQVQQTRP